MYRHLTRRLDAVATAISELNSDGRGVILGAVAAGWLLSIGIRIVYPVVLPHLREDFGLGLSTAGLLLTVLWAVYALGQFPGGLFSDRFGSGRVLIVSTAASAVALVLVVFSPTIGVLFVATGFLGLCTALFGPARFPLLSAVFPERSGTAIGITQASGNLGNSLLPLIAGGLATAFAWQFGFGFAIPLFIAVTVALWWVAPRRPDESTSSVETFSMDMLRHILADFKTRAVVVVVVIQVFGSSMYQGFTGFYPTYLIEVKGMAPGLASALFGLFFAAGMLIQPGTGAAGDRFGERRVLAVVLIASIAMLSVLPFVEGFWPLVAITIGLSTLLGRSVLTLTYLTHALSEEVRGTGLGLLRTGYILIGASTPFLVGVMADTGYFDEAFLALAGVAVVMLVLCYWLPERT